MFSSSNAETVDIAISWSSVSNLYVVAIAETWLACACMVHTLIFYLF